MEQRSANLHPWNLSVDEAIALQKELAAQVKFPPGFDIDTVRTVGGIDASYNDIGKAAISVVSLPDFTVTEEAVATDTVDFPYVPGLLSFRESPIALQALEELTKLPDVLMLDGQGYAHPRRFGIACHIGVLLDIPTIGVAKSVLIGTYENLGENPGDTAPLLHKKEVIGMAVRTKLRTNPLIISAGHKIDLAASVALVLKCVRRHRLPEPTRYAHLLAGGQSQREAQVGLPLDE